jgi:hypothetical protein
MQNACPERAAADRPIKAAANTETHQPITKEFIVNASRFAPTTLRPAMGRGAAVRGGYPLGLNGQISDCCRTDLHLPVSPASLWLEGTEDQMHPGEGSA